MSTRLAHKGKRSTYFCLPSAEIKDAYLELRNPPASASQVLGLKARATTAWPASASDWIIGLTH